MGTLTKPAAHPASTPPGNARRGTDCALNHTDRPTDAYDSKLRFADGSAIKVGRRERPSLVFDEHGQPTHLITGVQTDKPSGPGVCRSYTVLTEVIP